MFATVLDTAPIHGRHKGSGPMRRMQCDEIQVAALDVVQDALRRFFVNFALPHMPPPHDDVGPFEITGREEVGETAAFFRLKAF